MSATGLLPGADKMMKAMMDVDGIAYLTEIDMTIVGTGQMADMMSKMGPMRLTARTVRVGDPYRFCEPGPMAQVDMGH